MTKKNVVEVLPLTSLRFFLATWIVLFHLYAIAPISSGSAVMKDLPWLNTLFCGYVAVSVFFVLSGFVLALNYPLSASWDWLHWKKFAAARVSRIYPVYFLSLIVVAPVIVTKVIGQHSLAHHAGTFLVNALLLQSWVRSGALTWNGPSWSVSDEAFFYLCFPLIGRLFFSAASILKASSVLLGLWVVSLILPVAAIVAHVHGFADVRATGLSESSFSAFAKFNPLVNLPPFLAGICACKCFLILRQNRRLAGRGYLLYLPAFALLLTATSLGQHIPYPLMNGGCLLLPCSVGIVLGLALGDRYICKLLSNKALVFLGKASYAEYLLHFPIHTAFSRFGLLSNPVGYGLYLTATIAVSSLVFYFFEDPLHFRLRKLLTGGRQSADTKIALGITPRHETGQLSAST